MNSIRGQKRTLPQKKEVAINASIHNRFDIEVVDSQTGEVKQKAQADNVICQGIAECKPIKLHRLTSELQRFKFVVKPLLVLYFVSCCFLLNNLILDIYGYRDWETDRKSTRLNSSHSAKSRMPSSA